MKFDELLKNQLAIRRAVGAPFCESRLKILQELKEQGYRSSTLHNYSKSLIIAATVIHSYPPSFIFDDNTIKNIVQDTKVYLTTTSELLHIVSEKFEQHTFSR
ncbi:MAG: hypothetical protein MR051_08435 [Lentisphaeria bacterium]|nr:hypothetical protein [Lentisphaeria bacterium]